jgi:hypothetical protein
MPRYFFDVHDGASLPDREGPSFLTRRPLKTMRPGAGEILCQNPEQLWNGEDLSVEVRDERGFILFTLHVVVTEAAALRFWREWPSA